MAVSQRNFLPLVLIVSGIVLFAVLGFSTTNVERSDGDSESVVAAPDEVVTDGTLMDPAVIAPGVIDSAVVDEVARLVAEESVEIDEDAVPDLRGGNVEPPAGSKSASSSTKPVQSERLNLSGQTVDDALRRSAEGNFDITFDHIKFDIPEGEPYSPSMLTEQVRSLDGQEVKLRGYIRPSFKQRDIKNFVFVRDDKECCFGPGAALFDCVVVKLAKDQKTDYTVRPVAVTGKFVLKEYTGPDGNVWAIYRMRDAAVTQ